LPEGIFASIFQLRVGRAFEAGGFFKLCAARDRFGAFLPVFWVIFQPISSPDRLISPTVKLFNLSTHLTRTTPLAL
jgi:hypothetical protein